MDDNKMKYVAVAAILLVTAYFLLPSITDIIETATADSYIQTVVEIEYADNPGIWKQYSTELSILSQPRSLEITVGGSRISSIRLSVFVHAKWDCPATSWNVKGSTIAVKVDGSTKKTETPTDSGTLTSSQREYHPTLGPFTYTAPTIEGWSSEGTHTIKFDAVIKFNLVTPYETYTKTATGSASVTYIYSTYQGLTSLTITVSASPLLYGGGR